MYDLTNAFKTSRISKARFEKIKKEVRKDFPDDEMMYELHVIRYLQSLKRKKTGK